VHRGGEYRGRQHGPDAVTARLEGRHQVAYKFAFIMDPLEKVHRGYQPRMPASVLETRYGDCKDKSKLFVAMAKRLEAALRPLPKVQVSYPVETNAVFAKIPEQVVDQMHERGWKFYTHVGGWEDSRLMCSWDTIEEDVDAFAEDLTNLVNAKPEKSIKPRMDTNKR
jgi:hypothetical protein